MWFTVLCILAFIVCYCLYWYLTIPRNLPPGPLGLPIVGYVDSLFFRDAVADCSEPYSKLAQIYGPVVSYYCMNKLHVVINSSETIEEVYVMKRETFAGRDTEAFAGLIMCGVPKELTFLQAYLGKNIEYKKTSIAAFRGLVNPEARRKAFRIYLNLLTERLESKSPIKAVEAVECPVMVMSLLTLFGKTFEEDNQCHVIMDNLKSSMSFFFEPEQTRIKYLMGPYWPANRSKITRDQARWDFLKSLIRGEIRIHRASFNEREPKDLIDLCLSRGYSDDEILPIVATMWVDAFLSLSDETGKLLEFIGRDITLQTDIFTEVNQILKHDRLPEVSDKRKFPTLMATFWECLRFAPPFTSSLNVCALEDTTIAGFHIPKDTIVWAHWQSVFRNVDLWGDSDVFRPGRFIDDDGKLKKRPQMFPVFGAGDRQCSGRFYAEDMMVLSAAQIVNHFHLTAETREDGVLLTFKPRMK